MTAELLFLIPAHNEEHLLGACVDSANVAIARAGRGQVVVIADNCSDGTTLVARAAGARVLDRQEPAKRGKPFAIAWALERLDLDSADAIVIIDADSVVRADFASGLLEHAPLADKVIQTYNASSNEFETWLTRLAGVFGRARYEMEFPAKQRAGLNVPLTGNGMCIGTAVLRREGWKVFSLAEDAELYARWTAEGIPIRYAQGARVEAREAGSLGHSSTQRARWAAGRWAVFRAWAGPLVRSKKIGWRQKADALLELARPGPVVQLALTVLIAAVVWLLAPRAVRLWLVILIFLPLFGLVRRTVLVILRHPEPWRTLGAFAVLPLYLVWRSILAIRTTIVGDPEWRRSRRAAP
jgi:cellulose synthase/poly-beta-1,6-N-acetylglucosamine synthase-like glycosyltransferase